MVTAAKIRRLSVLLTKVFLLVLVFLALRLSNSVKKPPTDFETALHSPQAPWLAGFSVLLAVLSFVVRTQYGKAKLGATPVAAANRAFFAHLLALLLGEGVALSGLKLGLDTNSFAAAAPFFAAAAALYLAHWPREPRSSP